LEISKTKQQDDDLKKNNELELYDIDYLFNFFEDEKPNVPLIEDIKLQITDSSMKQSTDSNIYQNQLISLFDDKQSVNQQTSSIFEEIHKKVKLEVKEKHDERPLKQEKIKKVKEPEVNKIKKRRKKYNIVKKRVSKQKNNPKQLDFHYLNPLYTESQIEFVKNYLQNEHTKLKSIEENPNSKSLQHLNIVSFKLEQHMELKCVVCIKNCKKG